MPDLTFPRGDATTWATPLAMVELASRVDQCRGATGHAKGKALEQLLGWLLPHVGGFRVMSANVYSHDGSQEVDLVVWNELQASNFPSFGQSVLVEAKNWERKVDSSETAWFNWKLRRGNAAVGILVAANGVTGDANRRADAYGIMYASNADGHSILLICLEEIEALTSTGDLEELLRRKMCALTAVADPMTFGA